MKDTLYIAKIEDGKLSIYTKTKRFFREKLEKVDLRKFFSEGKESIKLGKSYSIIPAVSGLSSQDYLYQKSLFNLHKRESDFGQRTIWKLRDTKWDIETANIDNLTLYHGLLNGTLEISDTNGTLLFSSKNYSFEYVDTFEMDEHIIELLNQNACNGVYQTARETFELIDIFTKKRTGLNAKLRCEECGEIFDSIPAFYSHLIENKHYDSILDSNIYDPEVIRIKNVVKEED